MPTVKVVIVGCGRVGSLLARRLTSEGHDVSIVDINRNAFGRLGDGYRGDMVLGDGLDEETLRRAGCDGADCFASLTPGDNRNVMMAEIARNTFGVSRVITRIYDPIRAEIFRELGLETYCPTVNSADIIGGYFESGVNQGAPPVAAAARRASA